MAKIVLAGGTGNLGNLLISLFREQGHEIIVLSRQRMIKSHPKIEFVLWDAENLDTWQKKLEDADVLINLCGLSINRRFTKENQKLLRSSRLIPTKLLGEAIAQLESPVKLWINFSGVSIFNGQTGLQDETSHLYANDFLGQLAQDWERVFLEAKTPATEKVILRMSPLLSKKSGMFAELYPLTKMGLGGKVGTGKQMVSWIHETDFVRLMDWIIQSQIREGVYHACSPNPVNNSEFMKALRKEAGVSIGLPLPTFMAKIGAFVKNVDPVLLLESVPVTTLLTIKNGFQFNFPYIQPAFNQLIKSST
ncbi:TIGR01777 family oxidoreductase [Sphingobacterium cellulitidis]|uniref:TIGR01777 family oxidoreductase n=1 Tax=Sphingobacterium cellulitidis TaxID=1768011 RepID=UPI003C7CE731